VPKEAKVSLLLSTSVLSINRLGAYRFDATPPRVKVLAGKTGIRTPNLSMTVTVGRMALLDAKPSVQRFDKRDSDPFEQWSKSRAALLSRLLGQQTFQVYEPTRQLTQDDMDAVVKELPARANPQRVPVQSMPTPNSSSSGCMMPEW
jgi:hypothetical protein